MKPRRRVGLVVVTACAIVLSFSGLYDLAVACGFHPVLAAGVPVLADAGAALAADVWLDRAVATRVRRYARRVALSLISASVLGNIASHVLAAYHLQPHWVLVVAVAALAPAVVASNLHMSALVKDAAADRQVRTPVLIGMPGFRFAEPAAVDVPAAGAAAPARLAVAGEQVAEDPNRDPEVLARAREMAAAGHGRPAIKRELRLADHVAKAIVKEHKPRQEALA